jgi:hypothetical protein
MSTTSTFLWLNNIQLHDIGFIACVNLRFVGWIMDITNPLYTENKGFSSFIMKQLERGIKLTTSIIAMKLGALRVTL